MKRHFISLLKAWAITMALTGVVVVAFAQKRPDKNQIVQTALEQQRTETESWKARYQLTEENRKALAFQQEQYTKELTSIRHGITVLGDNAPGKKYHDECVKIKAGIDRLLGPH